MDNCAPVHPDVDTEELVAAAEEIEDARELVASALNRIRVSDPEAHAPRYVDTAYAQLTLADEAVNRTLTIRGVDRKEQTERLVESRR
ncbi:hypothetical protein [Halorarum salinum]|uniref:Uncharacterized protein n=1 Tax=Halorarum salinum TaxID=2743089 RepID=A0A7D5QEF8_9EURY|nr:hypothetical protein [Halobaculum salinum]QLG62841.1 hypothetical protein HUG12_14330 [Halobaculum salinum]